jgi:hypothetical protein
VVEREALGLVYAAGKKTLRRQGAKER